MIRYSRIAYIVFIHNKRIKPTLMRTVRNYPEFTHFACLPFTQEPHRQAIFHLQKTIKSIVENIYSKDSFIQSNYNLAHVTLSMLVLHREDTRIKFKEVFKQIRDSLANILRQTSLTFSKVKYFSRLNQKSNKKEVTLIYLQIERDEEWKKVVKAGDAFIRAMLKSQIIANNELKQMRITYDHNENLYKNEQYHLTLFRVKDVIEDQQFLAIFKQSISCLNHQLSNAEALTYRREIIMSRVDSIVRFSKSNSKGEMISYRPQPYKYKSLRMMMVNPCYFYQELAPITFHRNFMVLLMIFDLCLLVVLRLLTIFFRNQHKQRVDDILRREALQKDIIRVEEITGANPEDQNSRDIIKGQSKLAKQRQQKDGSQSSSSSDSSNREEQIQPEPHSQRYIIDLKRLRMTKSQLRDTYCIHLGHKFICLGVVLLYYPFVIASAIALTQTTIRIAYYICRICGSEGKLFSILNGSALMLNLPVLALSIYGLGTRVPDANGKACFDL